MNLVDKSRLEKLNTVTLNSISVYLFSLPLMFLVYQFSNVITALTFDIPTVLYHNKVLYFADPSFWTHKSVILTFGMPPLICFLLGIFFMLLYQIFRKNDFFNLLFLWMSLQGFNYGLGSILVGILTQTGFHHVTAWLYMKMPLRVIIALLALIGLIFIGFYVSQFFLKTAPTHALLTKERRLQFMTRIAFYPWVAGSLIYFLMMLPNNFNKNDLPMEKIFIQLSMLIIIIPAIIFNGLYQNIRLMKKSKKPETNWFILACAIIISAFLRGFIASGIHFGHFDTPTEKPVLEDHTHYYNDSSNEMLLEDQADN